MLVDVLGPFDILDGIHIMQIPMRIMILKCYNSTNERVHRPTLLNVPRLHPHYRQDSHQQGFCGE